jgi:predicted ATPase
MTMKTPKTAAAGLKPAHTEVSMAAAAGVRTTARSPLLIEAESYFQQALDIARRQQAKSLELRTAVSLSRLWQRQGKRGEGHELLAPIYSWFT